MFYFFFFLIQGCSNTIENTDLKARTLQAGHDIAQEYRKLLQTVLFAVLKPNSNSDSKYVLQTISRLIAQYVTELISVTEIIKGIKFSRSYNLLIFHKDTSKNFFFLGNDWVSPEDPTIIAENELLGAAESIDAAAKKLASLRPRRSINEVL